MYWRRAGKLQSSPVAQRTAWWSSKAGWAFLVAYLVLAAVLFHEALTCTGWVCDLAAIPAMVPLGFPIAWITDGLDRIFVFPGHVPSFHLRNWYFILPTVVANSLFYFWLGRQAGRLFGWLSRRVASRSSRSSH